MAIWSSGAKLYFTLALIIAVAPFGTFTHKHCMWWCWILLFVAEQAVTESTITSCCVFLFPHRTWETNFLWNWIFNICYMYTYSIYFYLIMTIFSFQNFSVMPPNMVHFYHSTSSGNLIYHMPVSAMTYYSGNDMQLLVPKEDIYYIKVMRDPLKEVPCHPILYYSNPSGICPHKANGPSRYCNKIGNRPHTS